MEWTFEEPHKLNVLFAVFDREHEATRVLDRLTYLAEDDSIELHDVTAVRRDPDLRVRITDVGGRVCRSRGVAEGIMAVIFPPSILVADAAGTVLGRKIRRFQALGLTDQDMQKVGKKLQPGQSALIVVIDDQYLDMISWEVQGYAKLDEYRLDIERGVVVAV
jgi:uncharacterized membrane protein